MNIYQRKNPPIGFYVYAYIRSTDSETAKAGTPYYIGKGKGNRAICKKHSISLPSDYNYIIILEQNLSEIGALALERRIIKWWGRIDNNTGILRNKTNGGEGLEEFSKGEQNGFYGKKHSNESKLKQSQVKSGKNNPMYGITGKDHHSYGTINVRDNDGNVFRVSTDDPRYVSGELLFVCKGISNTILIGKVAVRDKNGRTFMISKSDPKYQSGELVSVNKGVPKSKDSTCIHCGFISNASNISRWHNNNCKNKKGTEVPSITS